MERDSFEIREIDRQMAELYGDFLPKKIFDAHVHLHVAEAIPDFYREQGVFFRSRATVESYRRDMSPLLPGVEHIRMNMMPMPDRALRETKNKLRDKANEHVLRQQEAHPECAATPFILPSDGEKELFALAEEPGVCGFKCYCYGADTRDYEALEIGDFLPETAWAVANEKGLPIILHLMRPRALSDPENESYIMTMTQRYPDAQLVLAHCARGFASWTAVSSIQRLEDRGNIWFDLSGVCEPGPMMMCILKNGGKRTMWGSDYPICMNRGRVVSVGCGQRWLTGEPYSGPERSYIAAENLLAFWQASLILQLDQTQLNDLFYENAVRLFCRRESERGK